MPSPPTRRAHLAVIGVKCAIVLTIGLLALGSAGVTPSDGAATDAAPQARPDSTAAAASGRVAGLMAQHRCSASGFGADVVPGSALLRRDGHVRHVSFDAGWAAFTGDAPGTLIAVCLDPAED